MVIPNATHNSVLRIKAGILLLSWLPLGSKENHGDRSCPWNAGGGVRTAQCLNGKFGIVRDVGDDQVSSGRLAVKIFARIEPGKLVRENSAPAVSLRSANLKRLSDADAISGGYPILEKYLWSKVVSIRESMDATGLQEDMAYWMYKKDKDQVAQVNRISRVRKEELYQFWVERFSLPGFSQSVQDKVLMAGFLREKKRL